MVPELPALANDNSMLTKRFGKEVINYYAGSRLNRYSFLRSDAAFLRRAATSPSSRFLALNNLDPVVADKRQVAFFSYDDVKLLIGSDPFASTEDESIKNFDSTSVQPLIVFLGILPDTAQSVEIASSDHGVVTGQPYFALDVTPRASYTEVATAFLKQSEEKGLTVQTNSRSMSLLPEAGL